MISDLFQEDWFLAAAIMLLVVASKHPLILLKDRPKKPDSWLASRAMLVIGPVWVGSLAYMIQHGQPVAKFFGNGWWTVICIALGGIIAFGIDWKDLQDGRYSPADMKRPDKLQNTVVVIIMVMTLLNALPYFGSDVWEAIGGFTIAAIALLAVLYIDGVNHPITPGHTQQTY